MPRRTLEDRNVRKIFKSGESYCMTLPVEMIRELEWREGQKVQVSKRGAKIVIEDWKK